MSLAKLLRFFRSLCFFIMLCMQDTSAQLKAPSNWQETATAELMETISDWAGAWQAQLADIYITHYTLDYKAPEWETRAEWLADRRASISKPEYIKLRLIDFEMVELTENAATTRFTLIYERPGYSDETYKELRFIGRSGIWLIKEENNLRVTRL